MTFAQQVAAEKPAHFVSSQPERGLFVKSHKIHKRWVQRLARLFTDVYVVHEMTDGSTAFERWAPRK